MKKTAEQIALIDYKFEVDENGSATYQQIMSAALLVLAKETVQIRRELQAINRKLDALGRDGLHEVVREAKQQALLDRKRRLAKKRRA